MSIAMQKKTNPSSPTTMISPDAFHGHLQFLHAVSALHQLQQRPRRRHSLTTPRCQDGPMRRQTASVLSVDLHETATFRAWVLLRPWPLLRQAPLARGSARNQRQVCSHIPPVRQIRHEKRRAPCGGEQSARGDKRRTDGGSRAPPPPGGKPAVTYNVGTCRKFRRQAWA